MRNYNDICLKMEYSDYDSHFWEAMHGKHEAYDLIDVGRDISTGNYLMAPVSDSKFMKILERNNLFRQISTTIQAYGAGHRIWAKDTKDLAVFVPENGEIPLESTLNDFTIKTVDSYKLAVFLKTDEDFIRDAGFDFEHYLMERLAQNFGRAEENAFINGTGIDMPTGILSGSNGAEIGVTTDELNYDEVVKLFFSVKPEYRRNGVWLMNDETAFALRSTKDSSGNYIWNHSNDTILGKKVYISEYMPNAESASKPIAFGDFSYYWIVGRCPIAVRALKEEFVQMDQIGHLATEFLDGKLIRPEAIKVMQITDTAA